jgi:UDP-glucose 4-epimerase
VSVLQYAHSSIFNIGTGIETDVNAIFRTLRRYLKPDCPEQHGPAKQGEQLRSVIGYSKIQQELGWAPTVSLDEGLRRTAEFFKKKFD